jgi:hypothetical protein
MQLVAINTYLCVLLWQIFFVLRKKNNHISTLHVIHHGVMPMSVWFGVKFTPGNFTYLHFVYDSSWYIANERVVWSEDHTRYLYIFPLCV